MHTPQIGLSARARAALLAALALGALLALLALGAPAGTRATETYSLKSLRGSWGFTSSGTALPPYAPSALPVAVVGLLTFDGSGGCTVSETINAGGQSFSQTSTACTYTVQPDGTGTLLAQTPGGPSPIAFVITDNRSELRLIRTDQAVASGVARRQ